MFGTGMFYERRKQDIPDKVSIVGFLDNDRDIQGHDFDESKVYAPEETLNLTFDYVVIASIHPLEMQRQLYSLRIPYDKILFWEEFISKVSGDKVTVFGAKGKNNDKKVAIIVPTINFAGGFMTAELVADVLNKHGYGVTFYSPTGNDRAIQALAEKGYEIDLMPSILYPSVSIANSFGDYDVVWANSAQTIKFVNAVSQFRKVFWWIHEHIRQYDNIKAQYGKGLMQWKLENVRAFCVSNIASRDFKQYFKEINTSILTLGEKDFYDGVCEPHDSVNIAIIGNVSELKNQTGLIKACEFVRNSSGNKFNLWIIGRNGGKKYWESVIKKAKTDIFIRVFGEKNRTELKKLFHRIDVVACVSREETFSMSIVEGMMCRKICLTGTNTGVAEYISDGNNGFIYETGSMESLTMKLMYIVDNYNELNNVRENARNTFVRELSEVVFEKRISEILKI